MTRSDADLEQPELKNEKFDASASKRLAEEFLRSFLIFLAYLGVGTVATSLIGWKIPGNVVGMIALYFTFEFGILDVRRIERSSRVLNSQLGLYFVPPGVGIMLFFDLIRQEWLSMVVSLVGSTLVTLVVVGLIAKYSSPKEG